MSKKTSDFETVLKQLNGALDELKRTDITLEEAIKQYETGIKSYEECEKILKEAKQRISVYSPESEE